MSSDDFEQFAEDLRVHAGLDVQFIPAGSAESMHLLCVAGVDFFFTTSGAYDGWGAAIPTVRPTSNAKQSLENAN